MTQEKYFGKVVIEKKTFEGNHTFQATYKADAWLKEKGYTGGSSSFMKPTAYMKGDYDSYDLPWKMKNFTRAQEKSIHACIDGDFREGPMTAYIFE